MLNPPIQPFKSHSMQISEMPKFKKFFLIFKLFVILLSLLSNHYDLFSQKKTTINLIKAEKMIGRQTPDEELNIFTGAVLFEHDSVLLYCDSAVLRNKANILDAYNNIRIKINDTLNLYGNLLFYDGNTRLATVIDDVKLVDNDATLFTDKLWFNRNSGIGYYNTNGRIINNENELVSREGYFHTNTKILYFKKNVVLTNPDYRLESDTLVYNTSTEIAYISGPTTIRGKDEFMYAEEGWYETKNGKTMLKTSPYVIDGERYIAGDTIFYEKDIDAGDVFGNVFLKDTIQKLNVQGDYCKYRRGEGYAFVTQKPWATFVEKNDSLWLHADTLRLYFDSIGQADKFTAYNHCKFFKKDIQGKCDSLTYNLNDSTIIMYERPVVWTQDTQITSELIKIFTSHNSIDSMYIFNSAFIISMDETDPNSFNQVKGKNMKAYFTENELYKINVLGNSETIYFVREEDGSLIGINRAFSANMEIFVADRQITDIFYFDKPDATLFPEEEIQPNELRLRDFKWHDAERPKTSEDIFLWDNK